MKKDQDRLADAAEMRRRAEKQLSGKRKSQKAEGGDHLAAEAAARLVYELQVHQIELEMQNEEVLRARAQADALLAQYTDLYDFAPVGYFTLDRDGTISRVNLAGANLLGIARGKLVKRRFGAFVSIESRPAFSDFLEKVFAISRSKAICEVTLLKDGPDPLWVHIEASIDDKQECLAVVVDITERKQAEDAKAKLEAQLQQAKKMESIGRLAGGVAHDFNNMLGVILGHADLALDQLDPSQPLYDDLTEIRKAAERSANLTRQLLAFARMQTADPMVLGLNQTIGSMLNMLQKLIGENITLNWHTDESLWSVKIDPAQIDQILANLCVNARDAIPGIGKITIGTENCTLDDQYCADNKEAVYGEYVRLTVSDDGCGMDKDTLANIFEPFFTTKGIGKGTGLGLATIYGIVKQNNGFLNVYSEPGHGSTFSIYLPRHVDKTEQATGTEGVVVQPAKRGHETILLVEDELSLLKSIKTMLEKQGYTVLAASTPGEAIHLAREHGSEIHLLMTDVVMPEMNGRDLAKKLLSLYPHLKHLFSSGYTADIITQQGVLGEGVHFIQKPFTSQSLATKIREALDQA